MEELLRIYFLRAGYYVARGVLFNYEGFNVTDIDLWVYGRSSSVSREIAIVDIKNKKTPQAIERIFWVKGLQAAVGATNAIVATTDKRTEVKVFGQEQGISVLDGNFISRLQRSSSTIKKRITEEELVAEIEKYSLSKIDGDWRGRYIDSKTGLVKGLNFNSCNRWLENGRFFAHQVLLNQRHKYLAYRLCYLVGSYIAIAVDFLLRELSFDKDSEKEKSFSNGFRYGDRGLEGVNNVLNTSLGLINQFAENGEVVSNQVRGNLEKQLSELPTNILSQYFSKSEVGKNLFQIARELEELAMARNFELHSSSSKEVRGFIGCLLDFWGIDRVEFSGEKNSPEKGVQLEISEFTNK